MVSCSELPCPNTTGRLFRALNGVHAHNTCQNNRYSPHSAKSIDTTFIPTSLTLLRSQRHDPRQNLVIARPLALHLVVRLGQNRLLNLLVLALAHKDHIAVPLPVDHQVSSSARNHLRGLRLVVDRREEAVQVGEDLGRCPGGGEGVDADGETRDGGELGEAAAEAQDACLGCCCGRC